MTSAHAATIPTGDPGGAGSIHPAVVMRSIRKSFGAVEVLHGVDFDVLPGEVHVLAGENGAGKSTLIKILSGVHADFTGELLVHGAPHRFESAGKNLLSAGTPPIRHGVPNVRHLRTRTPSSDKKFL